MGNYIGFALVGAISLVTSACSPTIFFGGDEDPIITRQRQYREINLACAGIELKSSRLDVPTFDKLLSCFNSNGALEEIQDLVDRLSDEELQAVVTALNDHVLGNPKLLYQMESTYHLLKERKILDSTLVQLGRLLENEMFVVNSISLLAGGTDDGSERDRWLLLKAIERLGQHFTDANAKLALDYAISFGTAKSFQSLQNRFRGGSPGGRGLLNLVADSLLYFGESGDEKHVDLVRESLLLIRDGTLFDISDEVLGYGEYDLLFGVPGTAAVLKAATRSGPAAGFGDHSGDAKIFNDLTSLMHFLSRPVSCMEGAVQVSNPALTKIRDFALLDPDHVMELMRKGEPLLFATMSSVCDLPPELGRYYPGLISFSDTSAVPPMLDAVRSFHKRGLAPFLVRVLADTGSREAYGSNEDTAGIKKLSGTLAELTDRGVWDDLLLVASLPRVQDRADIRNTVDFLLEPAAELEGESIYDVVSRIFLKNTPENIVAFLISLKPFIDLKDNEKLLEPVLKGIHSAYHSNDVHPLLDFARNLMLSASSNPKLFDAVFRLSTDYSREVAGALNLVSQMAKDGRLNQLMGASVTLFHRFAQEGKMEIRPTRIPPVTYLRRHDWSAADLNVDPGQVPEWDAGDPCRALDPRIKLSETSGGDFDRQVSNMVSCISRDHPNGKLESASRFVRTETPTSGGSDFLRFSIELIKLLPFGPPEYGDMTSRWIQSVDDFRLFRTLRGISLWTTEPVASSEEGGQEVGPALEPLFRVLGPLFPQKNGTAHEPQLAVRRLNDLAAHVLRKPEFPVILKYLEDIVEKEARPEPGEDLTFYNPAEIRDWVRQVECVKDPSEQDFRIEEIIDDYRNAATSWNVYGETGAASPPRGWTFHEFQAELEPLFQKLGDPEQSASPDRTLVHALLNVMRYFSLEPGQVPNDKQHYTRKGLTYWLYDRSHDFRMIPYMYRHEGNPLKFEEHPRARLVNSLDLLELVLINADFTAMPLDDETLKYLLSRIPKLKLLVENSGLKYLAMIGEAWGDENPAIWPREIRERYQKTGKWPLTLRQAYRRMRKELNEQTDLLGIPRFEDCRDKISQIKWPKRGIPPKLIDAAMPKKAEEAILWIRASLFNLNQVLTVVEENLPLTQAELNDPRLRAARPHADGMKVLRNIFWELYMSSPVEDRNPRAGQANNLSVIIKLERMGLTRQVARRMKFMDREDPAMHDFFATLVDASIAPGLDGDYALVPLMHSLFGRDPEHRLVWRVIEQVFKQVDSSPAKAAYLRQLAFYLVADANQLGVIEPAIKSLNPILDQYYEFLARNADLVKYVLDSETLAQAVRALHEDPQWPKKGLLAELLYETLDEPRHGLDTFMILDTVDRDEPARRAAELFIDRARVLTQLSKYKDLKLNELFKDALHFFEEIPSIDEPQTAPMVREYVAGRLSSKDGGKLPSDIEEFLILGARKPAESYQVLEALSQSIDNGGLGDFLVRARCTLAAEDGYEQPVPPLCLGTSPKP